MLQNKAYSIFNARENSNNNWRIVNDGVMGGLSQSSLSIVDKKYALFKGEVSLANNGGFAMTQLNCDVVKVNEYSKVVINIKGDGKIYQFRLKQDRSVYYSYVQSFETSGNNETIELELDNFKPAFRGRSLNSPNFNHNEIEQIAILIGNKKQEDFSIKFYNIELR